MIRNLFNYLSTLLMCLAIVSGAMWLYTNRTPIKWSDTSPPVMRTIASSRGVLMVATDYWGGKPKSLAQTGGREELARWQDFDNRLRTLLRSGIGGNSGHHGFAFQSGYAPNGDVEWRLWAMPYWMVVAVLALPAFIRLLLPKRKPLASHMPRQ